MEANLAECHYSGRRESLLRSVEAKAAAAGEALAGTAASASTLDWFPAHLLKCLSLSTTEVNSRRVDFCTLNFVPDLRCLVSNAAASHTSETRGVAGTFLSESRLIPANQHIQLCTLYRPSGCSSMQET